MMCKTQGSNPQCLRFCPFRSFSLSMVKFEASHGLLENPTLTNLHLHRAIMGFGSLRNLIRPISRSFSTHSFTTLSPSPPFKLIQSSFLSSKQLQKPTCFTQIISRSIHLESLSSLAPKPFDPLTDSRFPKRRPSDKPRRKRSSLRPSGPYAWVKYSPGEPVPPSQPNQGSVKLRNEKKRRRQHREFVMAEKKKRMAQLKEANRKKREKRIERKMAAVAREREWAERLAELQRVEAEKKKSAA